MDAQVRKRRTLDAIKRILLRESLNQPLMVIFEDLHWIDEETQAFLNLLADSIGTAKILLLLNYRPEYSHQWGSKTYYTQLRLDPLGKESADEMLSAMLGDGAELAPLKRLIVEKTEGNPFFMEETVQVLLDESALMREGSSVRLTKALGELKIPPTVQAILAARIDRLPSDEKDLLQTLAVIGREFPMSLIRRVVAKSDDELNRMLNDLQLGEFIYEQPAVGDVEYTFKHALTQEVAYNSLLMERRRALHDRAGNAIEAIYADSLDDHLAELAHHFARSANLDKAVLYLALASTQALERFAYTESQALSSKGLDLLRTMPESTERDARELELVCSMVQAMWRAKGIGAPETLQMALRAAILAEKTGNLAELIRQLNLRRIIMTRSGDFAGAASLAHRLLELAEREGSAISFSNAYHGMLQAHFYGGDLVGTETQFALWRKYRDADVSSVHSAASVVVILNAALCALMMGRISLARDRMAEAIAFASAMKDPFALMIGKMLESLFYRHLREAMSARMFELRAATSLAHLLRDTDRRDETRATLAEIHNWFTEGFDTADLKAAKALLDELTA
ncbi:MAG: hypothetical protein WAU82_10410 [Candidatus Binatus sp.]|uniref:ATP-binding protein n=1 Tax=Candidatus Binatus sp. TaxID=2811406 RepID=UPI003BAFC3F4